MQVPSPTDDYGKSKCIKCGAEIMPTAKFCLECGAAQASQPVESIEHPVPGGESPSKQRRVVSSRFLWSAIVVAALAAALLGSWLWIGKHPLSAKGQYELGLKYENGDGVPRDYSQAAYWYHKSAEQGDADAQARLNLNDPMPSSCDMHLTEAQMRLIPENAQALNVRIEEVHKYITPEIAAYAMKQAWSDYQTESRLSHDKVCLAEWIAFVQGTQPSVLKDAGVPILPDESLSQINDAMQLCSAGLGAVFECKTLKENTVEKRRIEANFLAIDLSQYSPGKRTFKLTNRSHSRSLFNIYFALIVKDTTHHLAQKSAELTIPELRPGSSVTMAMGEVPGWMDAIRDFYKANNIHEDVTFSADFSSVSFRLQDDSQPMEFPVEWFDGSL